ncbi:hypothetical protein BIU88_02965 [Chlorobaculum limnaeum]|uniref:Uncharacterized protein n=1 Tax=Chlorobaculum limnaeum TaxID=274537 RepID=A0A1D8D2U3_CHLLM|nr:hypothetical protein BIU88_02965 [Chlorobaculum limnaeum]
MPHDPAGHIAHNARIHLEQVFAAHARPGKHCRNTGDQAQQEHGAFTRTSCSILKKSEATSLLELLNFFLLPGLMI